MRKRIKITIKEDGLKIYGNTVHIGDENVVEIEGIFKYKFHDDLNGVKVEIISKTREISKISETNVSGDKFKILLDNELFKTAGEVNNLIRLTKNDEVLYLNEDFNIFVKGENFEVEEAEKVDMEEKDIKYGGYRA